MTINTISTIQSQLKAALATAISAAPWPTRWPNEVWPASIALSEGNAPINLDGTPRPYIEAEIIAGADSGDIAPAGQRHSTRTGLFRVYLTVGQGTGIDSVSTMSDTIANYFKRTTVYYDQATGTRLITMDVNIDDGVAVTEDGDRLTRMLSCNFILDYYS